MTSIEADVRAEVAVLREIARQLRSELAQLESKMGPIPSPELSALQELRLLALQVEVLETQGQADERVRLAEELAGDAELAAERATQKATRKVRAMKSELKRAGEALALRKGKEREVRSVLAAYESSLSWRITEPLRRLRGWKRPVVGAPAPQVVVAQRQTKQRGKVARADVELSRLATIDVIVCVHNALADTKACLESVASRTLQDYRLIIVDDGSDPECKKYLREQAKALGATLVRHKSARGYTRAANAGLAKSTADAVVLLNSDTVVTTGWLRGLLAAAENTGAAIVGPLSNAASWQSVPHRFGDEGTWSTNPLPDGWTHEGLANEVREVGVASGSSVEIVNGFCMLVRREVLDAIGLLDEASFPKGYGEENDYCLRAVNAGFDIRIATSVYVHHEKSKSYSVEGRKPLAAAGREALARIHGAARVEKAVASLRAEPAMEQVRKAVSARLSKEPPPIESQEPSALERGVVFFLPVKGGGGGVHSIVQEAQAMQSIGLDARVAVPQTALNRYLSNYPSMPSSLFFGYSSSRDLGRKVKNVGWLIGTLFTSIKTIKQLQTDLDTRFNVGYYVQDYEPWIVPEGSDYYEEALASYTLIDDCRLFAKTDWICERVQQEHGVKVHRVLPSVDTSVYHPGLERSGSPVRLSAMVRPATPRRNPEGTVRVFARLARELGDQVEVDFFGCDDEDLQALTPGTFRRNHGVLRREAVAEVLRASHIFADLSTYQAFGRTSVEAMACGCAVVVPAVGGAPEFGRHEETALVVDTEDEDECFRSLKRLVLDRGLRERLATAATPEALSYSAIRAASSELMVLEGT